MIQLSQQERLFDLDFTSEFRCEPESNWRIYRQRNRSCLTIRHFTGDKAYKGMLPETWELV